MTARQRLAAARRRDRDEGTPCFTCGERTHDQVERADGEYDCQECTVSRIQRQVDRGTDQ